MGQAKQRGTFEQRVQQSLARKSKLLLSELEALPNGVTKTALMNYGKRHGMRRLALVMTMAQMIQNDSRLK